MTSDESILEEMLERYTNPNTPEPDNKAMQMFLIVLQSNSNLVTKAHELIVKKIQSSNVTEANRGVALLEECMSKGGTEFQYKTAKYVFLNELIALVMDKNPDLKAPVETKQRIMECLMLWSAEHPDKIKIQKAYENLKSQVNFTYAPMASSAVNSSTNKAATTAQRSSILGKDDLLLAKLLKEGGEENYKKANLVIQRSFNQEARRLEVIGQIKSELKTITDTMELLGDMLSSYSCETPQQDSLDIMEDLFQTCTKQNDEMQRWPDMLDTADTEFLDDIFTTKDQLVATLQRYKDIFDTDIASKTEVAAINKSLHKTSHTAEIPKSPASGAPIPSTSTSVDLLSELLEVDVNLNSSCDKFDPVVQKNVQTTTLDELFGSLEIKTENSIYPTNLLEEMNLLEPISVFETDVSNTHADVISENTNASATGNNEDASKPLGYKELREIDKLSEEIFKKSLKSEQRQATFKKDPEKITLNDLAKDKIQTSLVAKTQSNKKASLDITTAINETVDIHNETPNGLQTLAVESIKTDTLVEKQITPHGDVEEQREETTNENIILPTKPLAEISIDLDDITPLPDGVRQIFDDDDIQVQLNFTSNRPSAHVSVIVMSVLNKSKFPVKEFQFDASVKKPCKVRLLPPTATEMPPTKPFRPAAPINQVVLLLNTTQKPVDLTCVVSYKLGDDPDPIKEPIVAKDIAYV